MRQSASKIILLLFFAIIVANANAVTLAINSDSAKAVLTALQNPNLTREQCLKIAALPGNQGIIRKTREFGIDANTQNFADALYASAHGLPPRDSIAESYYFDTVKPKSERLLVFIQQLAASPGTFQKVIEKRIDQFTLQGTDLQLQGYLVAGGDGGGYAFGTTDFYLNVNFMDELITARVNTTHELYHAVQGAFATYRGTMGDLPSLKGMTNAQQACVKTKQLFANVYEEGTATYVEDMSQLKDSHSEIAMRQNADLTDGIKQSRTSASLLEMSVIAFNAQEAMAFDDVYRVGFFGHGILYDIGYVMAKAIVDQDGSTGLAEFLKLPPEQFFLRYTQLPEYGKDRDHPKLGPNTIQAANASLKGCAL